MKYRQLAELTTRTGGGPSFLRAARAVACDGAGVWYLAGDAEIQVFGTDLAPIRSWATGQPAWSLTVAADGRVWVGEPGQLEVFSSDGQLVDTWRDEELLGLVTAVAVTEEEVYVADARQRWVHRLDHERRLLNHIGDRHRKGGFHIPNGVLDFAVDLNGTVVVANPGMHRVEFFEPDGETRGHFGRFGQHDPEGFPGCCNPTNLAVGPNGEIVVSEKAGPRVKVYDGEGHLLAVVTGEDDFDPGCKNMDLAVSPQSCIGVVDTVDLCLALYEPVAASNPVTTPAGAGA